MVASIFNKDGTNAIFYLSTNNGGEIWNTELVEKKIEGTVTNVLMAFFGVYILAVGQQIESLRGIIDGPWLLPFGIIGTNDFYMADYMALIPWLGVFLVGTVVGRVCYASRKSLITSDAKIFRKISKFKT